ncbi:MAG: hypothetical protein ACOYI4_03350 [Christensenellales bacterium]|jgi:hypothetical protein
MSFFNTNNCCNLCNQKNVEWCKCVLQTCCNRPQPKPCCCNQQQSKPCCCKGQPKPCCKAASSRWESEKNLCDASNFDFPPFGDNEPGKADWRFEGYDNDSQYDDCFENDDRPEPCNSCGC